MCHSCFLAESLAKYEWIEGYLRTKAVDPSRPSGDGGVDTSVYQVPRDGQGETEVVQQVRDNLPGVCEEG